jgi:nicotinamidase-related amidase
MAMTTLKNRRGTALVVLDMQNGVLANAYRRDEVIANVRTLVNKARSEKVPVIWVQHFDGRTPKDSEGWQYVTELQRDENEPLIHKSYGDAFESTEFESELAQRNISRIFVTGAQTDNCVRATLHGAFTRGYDVLLVSDAHTTEDFSAFGLPSPEKVIAHTNMYWTWQSAPGRLAHVIETAELSFR